MDVILAIETSCDETAAAVVAQGRRILSNVVASQVHLHQEYGGVFPEMASREHIRAISLVVEEAMAPLERGWDDIEALAVTHGPGLSGSLLVGVNVAKGIAFGRGLPLLALNHIVSHIYANWLIPPDMDRAEPVEPEPQFPLLVLVVSGGHTTLVLMRGHDDYEAIGQTVDDAAGEAFDKVARLLGLPYPGGPEIEKVAAHGLASAVEMPRMRMRDSYDFSFSGLKTAALRLVESYGGRGEKANPSRLPVANIAAAFQEAVVDALVSKTAEAAQEYGVRQVLLAGGVAANSRLRQVMSQSLKGIPLRYPPKQLCTDNAAMVAAAAYYQQESARVGWDLDVYPGLGLPSSDGRRPSESGVS
ncbi:MAG: tRNA (adenosine(37)-N6)-threonylcarbamoyltransferase complex transferase subunit TsaD [Anaerolineae bacterium]|nr:tRNA (adenosine(37)-N6)-threonylcarbamoyltransferase complex transferase subunit TsaD [Anaerolineae bacterium]